MFLGVLQVTPARTGRGEEVVTDPCLPGFSGGGTWRRRVPAVPKASLNHSRQFQDFLGAVL